VVFRVGFKYKPFVDERTARKEEKRTVTHRPSAWVKGEEPGGLEG